MNYFELNMDGLVGPTHHYAGLSSGNIASITHAGTIANPRDAALQGLKKMRKLHHMGIKQAILPPHQRPNLKLLSQLGFSGPIRAQIKEAKKIAPDLLSACFSASSMWTANIGTTASSLDTKNGRVHFTPANLLHNIHRSQEADFSFQLLKKIFSNDQHFEHHPPLIRTTALSDEGAANHSRLCQYHRTPGVHLFVYGKRMLPTYKHFVTSKVFAARQTIEASQNIARLHQLDSNSTIFIQQNPFAIDKGVFHNDVIAVANESVLLLHEKAFLDQVVVLQEIREKTSFPIQIIEIKKEQISLEEAVKSYLFNSQLISLPNGKMALIAPYECEENSKISLFIDELIEDSSYPISEVHYLNLKQSMQNGGGPACLRFRVVLSDEELGAMHQGVLAHDALLDQLEIWVQKHYRTSLHANDLEDPSLIQENFQALDELTHLLDLGPIYPFQQER